jgi:hypothetical protein
MPGIGDEMDTAMQQAAHPIRHSMPDPSLGLTDQAVRRYDTRNG